MATSACARLGSSAPTRAASQATCHRLRCRGNRGIRAGERLIPVFRQIVAMPQVTLPVAGVSYNVNSSLGHDGIVGVKTGSGSPAGGCLAFAALRTVAGRQITIVGVVLGVQVTSAQPSELGGVICASENLLTSVGGDLEHVGVVRPGTVLGSVSSAWTAGPAAVAATGVSVTAWPGTPVTVTVTPRPRAHAISQGQPIARATVTVGSQVSKITLDASQAAPAPPVRWRLTRLLSGLILLPLVRIFQYSAAGRGDPANSQPDRRIPCVKSRAAATTERDERPVVASAGSPNIRG